MISPIFLNKINSINSNFIKNQSRIAFMGAEKSDSFEKSIRQQSENSFANWAKENDFLNSGLISSISDKSCFLGAGYSHCAFKIKGNDEYVIRIALSKVKDADEINSKDYEIIDVEDRSLDVNIGQKVAIIKSKGNNNHLEIEILKAQKGISNGNPPASAIYDEFSGKLKAGHLPYEAKERKEHFAKCLQILANMPDSSYDDFLEKMISASNSGYSFDFYNPNNILLDEDTNQINAIDFEKKLNGEKINIELNLGALLAALVNISYLNTYESQYDNNPINPDDINVTKQNIVTVIRKYLSAMKRKGLKFKDKSIEFNNLLNAIPFYMALRTINPTNTLIAAGLMEQ